MRLLVTCVLPGFKIGRQDMVPVHLIAPLLCILSNVLDCVCLFECGGVFSPLRISSPRDLPLGAVMCSFCHQWFACVHRCDIACGGGSLLPVRRLRLVVPWDLSQERCTRSGQAKGMWHKCTSTWSNVLKRAQTCTLKPRAAVHCTKNVLRMHRAMFSALVAKG